jgi:transaldolase
MNEGGYASKMLACSMRVGPLVAGMMRFWDVEKLAGGDIVYTCPSYVLEPLFEIGDELNFGPEIVEDPPVQGMDKLLKIPFCIQAYDPNGLELEQFNDHPSTVSTVEAFSKGFTGLDGFIHDRMTVHH